MQFSKILVSAFAAFAAAAPATTQVEERSVEARSVLDAPQLAVINNGAFANKAFGYLTQINGLGFNQVIDPLFASLVAQNFQIQQFSTLFNSQVFGVDAIFQLAQLQLLHQVHSLGLLNGFDLSTFQLAKHNFGLLGGISQFNFDTILDSSVFPQVNAIAKQNVVIIKE